MKLSTRARYGLRAILELGLNYGKGIVTLSEISQKQEISERYLERIMSILVSSGLVTSLRGQHGGFTLAKDPSEIRLSEVIQVLEGSLSLVPCLDNPKICKRVNVCVVRDVWVRMKNAMLAVLDSITLRDMIKMQMDKYKESTPIVYNI